MDKEELEFSIHKKTIAPNSISVGVSWIDGRVIFPESKRKWSMFWYGICHFSDGVFAVTPLDYDRPTMITQIMVAPVDLYCERAGSCLNFTCKLNRFNRDVFIAEFRDCGEFSLGLPLKVDGSEPLWFSEGRFKHYWGKLLNYFHLKPEGGKLEFDKLRAKNIGLR